MFFYETSEWLIFSYNKITSAYETTITKMYIFDILNSLPISMYSYLASVITITLFLSELLFTLLSDSFSSSMLDSIIVSIKFILLVALLVFIRGGIPRYRFDHLTKMGWIKFLSLVLASILIEMLLIWIF